MYILNGPKKEIINSDFAERFCIVERDDATLIVASYGDDRRPVTVSKYRDLPEARQVLGDMLAALAGGQASYEMPESSLFYEQRDVRDARTRRRGGS